MSYIYWLGIAILLLLIEIMAPAFFFVFFAFSALIVAFLKFFGFLPELSAQILVFSIAAIASLLLLRQKFKSGIASTQAASIINDQSLILSVDIPAQSLGQVEYQGSAWAAFNQDAAPLRQGESAYIIRIDGVKLILSRHKGE